MCPDCGSHLDDSWDDDEDECAICGFAYVRNRTQVRSRPPKLAYLCVGHVAGLGSFLLALGAGMSIAGQQFVSSTQTGVQFSSVGQPFISAVVLGAFSLLLLTFLIHRGAPQ